MLTEKCGIFFVVALDLNRLDGYFMLGDFCRDSERGGIILVGRFPESNIELGSSHVL